MEIVVRITRQFAGRYSESLEAGGSNAWCRRYVRAFSSGASEVGFSQSQTRSRLFRWHGRDSSDKVRQALQDIPVMLVTNYVEHQQAAIQLGAMQGFGKLSLSDPQTTEFTQVGTWLKQTRNVSQIVISKDSRCNGYRRQSRLRGA